MWRNIMQLGNLNLTILKSISESEKYGLEIIEDITKKTNGQVIIKQPSLYSGLRRLEQKGLISSRWEDSELGGRRHYYAITNLGRSELQMHRPEEFLTSFNAQAQEQDSQPTIVEAEPEIQLTKTESQPEEVAEAPREIPTENIFVQNLEPVQESAEPEETIVESEPETTSFVDKIQTLESIDKTNEESSTFEQVEQNLGVTEIQNLDKQQDVQENLTENSAQQPQQDEQFAEFNPSDKKENKRKSFSDKMRDYVEPENNYDEYKLDTNSPAQPTVEKDAKIESEPEVNKIANTEKLANNFSSKQDTVVEYVHAKQNDDIDYKDILGELDADLNKSSQPEKDTVEPTVIESVSLNNSSQTVKKPEHQTERTKSAYEKELEEILLSSKTDDATHSLSIKETDRMQEVNRKYGTGTLSVKPDEVVEDESFDEDIHKIAPKDVGFTYLNQENITVKPYKKSNKAKAKTGLFLNVNKLNLVRSTIMFVLMALELVATYFVGNTYGIFEGLETTSIILFSVSASIAVLYFVISLIYTLPNLSKKIKTENINFGIDFLYRIIMCAFIVLFILGLNLFMGMPNIISWLLPCVMASNILISWLVGVIAYSTKAFHA